MRTPTQKNEYWIPKQAFLTAVHYCLQYPEWKAEKRRILMEAEPRSAAPDDRGRDPDPTMRAAVRLAEVTRKIDIVEQTAKDASPDLYKWLLKGVTRDLSYNLLRTKYGIPCGRDEYSKVRRRFYYMINKKI